MLDGKNKLPQMKDEIPLFSDEDLAKEWVGMPEFVQEKQEPFSKLIVRFETEQDLQDFAKLIGQKLTPKTKSIWHPFKSHWGGVTQRWVDES